MWWFDILICLNLSLKLVFDFWSHKGLFIFNMNFLQIRWSCPHFVCGHISLDQVLENVYFDFWWNFLLDTSMSTMVEKSSIDILCSYLHIQCCGCLDFSILSRICYTVEIFHFHADTSLCLLYIVCFKMDDDWKALIFYFQ